MSFEADQPNREPDQRVPDALVDALFDRELSPDAQREILRAVRHDRHAGHELERTAEALAALRDQPLAPDLTDRILARADGRRRFLPRRLRRLTRVTRLGVSGAMLLVLLGVAGAQRAWPHALSLSPAPTPLTEVNDAFRGDALESANSLRAGVDRARVAWSEFPSTRANHAGFVGVERLAPDTSPAPRFPGLTRVAFSVETEVERSERSSGARLIVGAASVIRVEARATDPRARYEREISVTRLGATDKLRGAVP